MLLNTDLFKGVLARATNTSDKPSSCKLGLNGEVIVSFYRQLDSSITGLIVTRFICFGSFRDRRAVREMSVVLKKITGPLVLGEGPHWDERAQALFFVSILEQTIHKYVPATGQLTTTKLDGRPGFIIPVEGKPDQFLVGLERQFVVIQWDGAEGSAVKVVRTVGEVDQLVPKNRLNDGKADPRGRVYAGSMGQEQGVGDVEREKGSLFRVDGQGITPIADRITISNGLAWDVAARAMYYIDSPEAKIRKYDYNVETGEISNLQYFFDLRKNGVEGIPDGCTIDTEGNLWVAVFGGSCVLQVSPRGTLLRSVPIPAKQVTSCTFGGPSHDVLFVTTANLPARPEDGTPGDGCTYMVSELGARGHPNANFKF